MDQGGLENTSLFDCKKFAFRISGIYFDDQLKFLFRLQKISKFKN